MPCPQIVGFHVVALHFTGEVVNVVVGIYRSLIIPAVEGGEGDVAVDVLAARVRVARQIVPEYGYVGVEVEGELGIVEHGILLYGLVP